MMVIRSLPDHGRDVRLCLVILAALARTLYILAVIIPCWKCIFDISYRNVQVTLC